MTSLTIRVFQVDDWSYVAAKSAEDAASFIENEYERPENSDDHELQEIDLAHNEKLAKILEEFIKSGNPVPALIGIDHHYQ